MKTLFKQSLALTCILIVLTACIYPMLIAGAAKFSSGSGGGAKIERDGKVIGYSNIGQSFTEDRYFNGRPSAVNYNAAGSGGSNKSTTNPNYLKTVQERIDTFMLHNPTVLKQDIPTELITASGSGLDPDVSPKAAYVQIARISAARGIPQDRVKMLVDQHIHKPLLGIFGTYTINVLELNIDLDALNKN